MHTAMANLTEDHQTINTVVCAWRHTAHHLMDGQPVDLAVLRQSIAFLEGFLEHYHYGKEEGFLFPAVDRALNGRTPFSVGKMRSDHERSRRQFRLVKDAIAVAEGGGPEEAWKLGLELTRCWIGLTRHMQAEERPFYVTVERLFGEDQVQALTAEFDLFETPADGTRRLRDVYRAVAGDVAAALRADDEDLALAG